MRFLPYNPEQDYLLPPSVHDVLSPRHLCFFVQRVVARLDLSAFEQDYEEEGRPAYHPALMLSVWLYAYALGLTSARRLEQRVREDLAFRYLAGGAQPDYWTLNEFRQRHPKALNDLFTQVVELARKAGLGRLGHVAIDSTRVKANASPNRVDSEKQLRAERLRIRRQIRRWQQVCNAADPNEAPGLELAAPERARLEEKLAQIPPRLEQLIVEQWVTQETTDRDALLPMVEGVKQRCGKTPQKVSANSSFFALDPLKKLEKQKLDAYVPDSNLARVLNRGGRLRGRAQQAVHRRMRRKLRSPAGREVYRQRKALIEPVFGVLKEQRGMRQFRRRGLEKAAVEMSLAATAYNLTRLWNTPRAVRKLR